MRPTIRIFSAIALLVLTQLVSVSSASAATRTVCPAGPPACGYSSIQAAVDAAASADRITISAGTWNESIVIDKTLYVEGPWHMASLIGGVVPPGAATILGAGDGSPALRLSGGARVSGLEVTGIVGNAGVVLDGRAQLNASWVHGNTLGIRMIGDATLSDRTSTTSIANVLVENNNQPGLDSGIGIDSQGVVGGATVLVRGHASRGIRLQLPSATSRFNVLGRIEGSPIGIEASGPGSLSSGWEGLAPPALAVVVEPGGTGVSATGLKSVELYNTAITGTASATGTSGVVLDGAGSGAWLERVDLLDLDVPIRYASSFGGGWNAGIRRSRIRPTGRDAAIVNESTQQVTLSQSLVGCSVPPCQAPLARGPGPVREESPAALLFEIDGKAYVPPDLDVGKAHTVGALWGAPDAQQPMTIGAVLATVTLSASGATVGASQTVPGAAGRVSLTPTGAGQDIVLTASVDGRSSSTASIRVVEPDVALVRNAAVVGIPHAGRTLVCRVPVWAVTPAAIAYEWRRRSSTSSDRTVHMGRFYRVKPFDAGMQLWCEARATWPTRRDHYATSRSVKASLRPRSVVILPMTPRGFAMGCGVSPARACVIREGELLRFAINSAPVQQISTTWIVQLRIRGSWGRATSGRISLPNRRYIALQTAGAPTTLYRIHASIGSFGVVDKGLSPWRYWRVR